LVATSAILIGFWPVLGGEWLVGIAIAAAVIGGVSVKRSRTVPGVALGLASVLVAPAAMQYGGPLLGVTATLALGGITGEMLLGHWYLVDPTMPRLVLRALAIGGMIGLAIDTLTVVATVGTPEGGIAAGVFWVL